MDEIIVDNSIQVLATDANLKPVDLEETPEFKAWSQAKIKEFIATHKYAWRIDIPEEKLFMKDDGAGYPDPVLQQKAHKFVSANHRFRDSNGDVLINPATGRPMSYLIWQSILPNSTGE